MRPSSITRSAGNTAVSVASVPPAMTVRRSLMPSLRRSWARACASAPAPRRPPQASPTCRTSSSRASSQRPVSQARMPRPSTSRARSAVSASTSTSRITPAVARVLQHRGDLPLPQRVGRDHLRGELGVAPGVRPHLRPHPPLGAPCVARGQRDRDQLHQPAGRRGGAPQPPSHLGDEVVGHGGEGGRDDGRLVGEVVGDDAGGEPRLAADVAQRRHLEAIADDHAHRGVARLAAALLGAGGG